MKDARDMTGPERREELDRILHGKQDEVLTFGECHHRIEELVGRPVWTHEIGLAPDRLLAEAAGEREHATVAEVLNDLLKAGKPVIVLGE